MAARATLSRATRGAEKIIVSVTRFFISMFDKWFCGPGMAAGSSVAPSTRHERLLEDCQITVWLFKDFFWALLYPNLSIAFGSLALLLQAVIVYSARASPVDALHSACILLWISGNFAWMLGESFYEETESDINLGGAPTIRNDDTEYQKYRRAAEVQFGASLFALLVFYVCFYRRVYCVPKTGVSKVTVHSETGHEVEINEGKQNTPTHGRDTQPTTSQHAGGTKPQSRQNQLILRCFPSVDVYERVHVLCWLVKDLFWSLNVKPLGILGAVVTTLVGMHVLVLQIETQRQFWYALCVLLWVLANSTWMIGEMYENDQGRMCAAVFFVLGECCLVSYLYVEWAPSFCWKIVSWRRRHRNGPEKDSKRSYSTRAVGESSPAASHSDSYIFSADSFDRSGLATYLSTDPVGLARTPELINL